MPVRVRSSTMKPSIDDVRRALEVDAVGRRPVVGRDADVLRPRPVNVIGLPGVPDVVEVEALVVAVEHVHGVARADLVRRVAQRLPCGERGEAVGLVVAAVLTQ